MQRKTTPPLKDKHFPWFKFKHYLLGNKFVPYINHMALLYLVKKPRLLRQIMKWLLLFLEYKFLVAYKLGCSHLVVDIISQLPNVIKILGVLDRTIDASLFILHMEWLHEVHTYISTNFFLKGYSTKKRKKLVLKALPFTIINGKLYKQGQDQILCQHLHDEALLQKWGVIY
jgi:hypothetical protein